MNVKWPGTLNVKEKLNEHIMKILHFATSAFDATVAADINPNHIVLSILNSLIGILLDSLKHRIITSQVIMSSLC